MRAASLPRNPRERQALPPTRISVTSGESPSSPTISRSSTFPQFRPSLSTSWWSKMLTAMSTSVVFLIAASSLAPVRQDQQRDGGDRDHDDDDEIENAQEVSHLTVDVRTHVAVVVGDEQDGVFFQ